MFKEQTVGVKLYIKIRRTLGSVCPFAEHYIGIKFGIRVSGMLP